MPFRASLILVTALTSGILALAQSGDAGSLDAARQLYGSADCSGALDMLDRLLSADPSAQDRQSIDRATRVGTIIRTDAAASVDRSPRPHRLGGG